MKKIQGGGGSHVIVAMRGRNIVDGKRKDFNGAPTVQRLEMNMNDESNCLTGVQKDNLVLQLNQSADSELKIIGNVFPSGGQAGKVYDTDGISPTVSGQRINSQGYIAVKSATKDGFEVAKEGDSINLSMPNSKTRRGRVGVGVAQTLDTQSNQSVLLSGKIRRLTEIECERLQGMPDNWTQYGMFPKIKISQEVFNKLSNEEKISLFNSPLVKKPIPKGQRYKLCGNAVTRDIVELVGKKIHHALTNQELNVEL